MNLSVSAEGRKLEEISIDKLYEISMTNKIIVSMTLPPMDDNKFVFKSYKVRFGIYLRKCYVLNIDD